MKKLLILVLIVAVLVMAAAPVLAAETGWGPAGVQGAGNYAEPGWATEPGNSTGWGIEGDQGNFAQGNFAGDGEPGWAGLKP